MKIKLHNDPTLAIKLIGSTRVLRGGETYDIEDEAFAKKLIEGNFAVEVEESETKEETHENKNA